MNSSDKIKKITTEFSRIVLGGVLIFSGFVKAVDPLGGVYKLNDYFDAFGMPFFNTFALPLSFIQAAFEFALGAYVLFGIYRRMTSFLTLVFMLFMTPLTLYIALKDPVTDCGCFGDALLITNWETFYKNIFLLLASFALFYWKEYITPVFSKKTFWLAGLYIYLFAFGLTTYCYLNLPILDFRPYKIGTHIPDSMVIPEGMPSDEYKSIFIYEKDGVQKEFTLEDYPEDDPSWVFVDSRAILVKKGYQPPIHDFTITDSDGFDITDAVLADARYTFLLISYKFDKANDSNIDAVNELYDYSLQHDYPFYCLTASTQDDIEAWVENMGAEYPICTTDEITLKTIIRSNPGLVLMKEGKIINKWHHRNLPEIEDVSLPLEDVFWGRQPDNKDGQAVAWSVGILLLPLAFMVVFNFNRRKKDKE